MSAIVAVLFAALEYVLGLSIGLPSVIALVIAVQVGVVAAMFVWLGGIPNDGPGLGRRW
jgi:hypothetical protein